MNDQKNISLIPFYKYIVSLYRGGNHFEEMMRIIVPFGVIIVAIFVTFILFSFALQNDPESTVPILKTLIDFLYISCAFLFTLPILNFCRRIIWPMSIGKFMKYMFNRKYICLCYMTTYNDNMIDISTWCRHNCVDDYYIMTDRTGSVVMVDGKKNYVTRATYSEIYGRCIVMSKDDASRFKLSW